MKKSELYKYAQGVVCESNQLTIPTKLELLRELMKQEDSALFWEKQEEKSDSE